MNTIEIPEISKVFKVPQSLSECNRQQYINICYYLYQLESKQITFDQFKSLALYKLMGLEYTKNSKLSEEETSAKNANLYMLSELIEDFFCKDEDNQIQGVKLEFLNNPVPEVKYEGCTYYGPTDVFQNITLEEYWEGLEYFTKYIDGLESEREELANLEKEKEELVQMSPDLKYLMENCVSLDEQIEKQKRVIYLKMQKKSRYLRELFAVFYRPKRSDALKTDNAQYDVRKPFNKYMVFKQSEKFVRLDWGIIYGFFLFFAAFQTYLDQLRIDINGQEIDLSVLFEKDNSTTKDTVPGLGFLSVAFTISQAQVFGDFEKVKKTPFWDAILHMYDVKKKYLDEMNEMKKTQNG